MKLSDFSEWRVDLARTITANCRSWDGLGDEPAGFDVDAAIAEGPQTWGDLFPDRARS